jgi:hypothetical protein
MQSVSCARWMDVHRLSSLYMPPDCVLCPVVTRLEHVVVESLVEERGRPRIWTHTPVSGEYTGACANWRWCWPVERAVGKRPEHQRQRPSSQDRRPQSAPSHTTSPSTVGGPSRSPTQPHNASRAQPGDMARGPWFLYSFVNSMTLDLK